MLQNYSKCLLLQYLLFILVNSVFKYWILKSSKTIAKLLSKHFHFFVNNLSLIYYYFFFFFCYIIHNFYGFRTIADFVSNVEFCQTPTAIILIENKTNNNPKFIKIKVQKEQIFSWHNFLNSIFIAGESLQNEMYKYLFITV